MPLPRTFATANEVLAKGDAYIAKKTSEGKPLTMAGFAVFCKCSRETINQYESGAYDTEEENYSDAIKRVKALVEEDKIEKALMGEYNATIAIFDLKNNHGYADKQDVNQHVNGSMNHNLGWTLQPIKSPHANDSGS